MPELTIDGAAQLRELAGKLRGADPKIRREITTALRPEVKKLTAQVQETVRSAPSKGRQGLGHQRRAAHTLARTRRPSETRVYAGAARRARGPASEQQIEASRTVLRGRQQAKAEAGAGLRESIANATTGSISSGSKSTGVSVSWRVRAAKMANSQRKLPKYFNREKGWRHPVFGDREDWVTQKGHPYFDAVLSRNAEELGRKVVDGMQRAADAIIHE